MSEPREAVILHALEEVALRAAAAGRLEPPRGEAVLRSVVDATVALFDAEAASIAIHDAARVPSASRSRRRRGSRATCSRPASPWR